VLPDLFLVTTNGIRAITRREPLERLTGQRRRTRLRRDIT
jgi:hypothetical protein